MALQGSDSASMAYVYNELDKFESDFCPGATALNIYRSRPGRYGMKKVILWSYLLCCMASLSGVIMCGDIRYKHPEVENK
jgi:hypothetical protein